MKMGDGQALGVGDNPSGFASLTHLPLHKGGMGYGGAMRKK